MLTKTAIRFRDKTFAFRLNFGFGFGVTKHEPHIDETGRYLNVYQAAQIVTGVTQRTLHQWANLGETHFGFPLRTKRIPVEHHRYYRRDEPPGKHQPMQDRIMIFEPDVLALQEILKAGGRTKPGPWTDDERATITERAIAVMRRRQLTIDLH